MQMVGDMLAGSTVGVWKENTEVVEGGKWEEEMGKENESAVEFHAPYNLSSQRIIIPYKKCITAVCSTYFG